MRPTQKRAPRQPAFGRPLRRNFPHSKRSTLWTVVNTRYRMATARYWTGRRTGPPNGMLVRHTQDQDQDRENSCQPLIPPDVAYRPIGSGGPSLDFDQVGKHWENTFHVVFFFVPTREKLRAVAPPFRHLPPLSPSARTTAAPVRPSPLPTVGTHRVMARIRKKRRRPDKPGQAPADAGVDPAAVGAARPAAAGAPPQARP